MIEMKEGFALNKLKLLTMSDIPTEEMQWLWYPYLPRGKITIIRLSDSVVAQRQFPLALVDNQHTGAVRTQRCEPWFHCINVCCWNC